MICQLAKASRKPAFAVFVCEVLLDRVLKHRCRDAVVVECRSFRESNVTADNNHLISNVACVTSDELSSIKLCEQRSKAPNEGSTEFQTLRCTLYKRCVHIQIVVESVGDIFFDSAQQVLCELDDFEKRGEELNLCKRKC